MESLRLNLGPLLCSKLDDHDVRDVMLNGDGTLHEDRAGAGMTMIGTMSDDDALAVINLIASISGETINRKNPVFEGELLIRNARFIAFVPPIVPRPAFSIRLPAVKIYTMADYVAAGIATEQQAEVIDDAILRELGILVSGGTQTGKTTLLNAVFERYGALHPAKRICLIEEIVELQIRLRNVLALRTGTGIDHQELLKRVMRCRPDAIAFGEVRDKAALQLAKAANTGHGSIISTIHANSPRSAPKRIEDLCAEALPGVDLRAQVADALGIIVGISKVEPEDRKEGQPDRRITEIVKVEGVQQGEYVFRQLA